MTRDKDLARQLALVSRWRELAEQRLEYLNELYESGRWRRYHTEQAFVDNVRDAKRAVEAWRKLEPLTGSRVADVDGLLRYADLQPVANVSTELLPSVGI
ncbi:MAG: hypothetical protein A4S14_03170 [Proteobacteria bacterium SG_bin9]|nr:MAG: hypothetical protein A4S14_03170 [Proteobacteria bacterium SG_bin9]